MAWDTHGVWLHTFSEEEKNFRGGPWIIGNSPFDQSADYPGLLKGEPDLLFKSWVATQEGYAEGKYPPKDRVADNCREYVRTLRGVLQYRAHVGGEVIKRNLHCRTDGVDIAPTITRSWFLPENQSMAAGVTILRRLHESPLFPSYDYTYELVDWAHGYPELSGSNSLKEPLNLADWNCWCLLVFAGSLRLTSNCRQYDMYPGQVAFVRRSDAVTFYNSTAEKSHGVGLFFTANL